LKTGSGSVPTPTHCVPTGSHFVRNGTQGTLTLDPLSSRRGAPSGTVFDPFTDRAAPPGWKALGQKGKRTSNPSARFVLALFAHVCTTLTSAGTSMCRTLAGGSPYNPAQGPPLGSQAFDGRLPPRQWNEGGSQPGPGASTARPPLHGVLLDPAIIQVGRLPVPEVPPSMVGPDDPSSFQPKDAGSTQQGTSEVGSPSLCNSSASSRTASPTASSIAPTDVS
jgi:hypothetical protein